MGGPHYNDDVSPRRSASINTHFNYRGESSSSNPTRREVHDALNIKGATKGKTRECRDSALQPNSTPIVVAMDVTRSRGDDAKVVFEKLPMLMGQLYMKGYVSDPNISFAAIGDATCGDKAPIQIGQFESDERLDAILGHLWLEEGGGGTGEESYELTAYYYANHAELDCIKHNKKGYFFFIGDEGFYPKVAKDQVKAFIGDTLAEDMDSAKAFADLQKKFHVFFIYPQKGWEQRKSDIDAEIQQRVESAGGQFKNVDIRASLLWNNRNDLDLHMITPRGEHIYFHDKTSSCGGALDVDMNVNGETTKPAENIRWKRGTALKGKYRIFVQNFRFHEGSDAATPFRVEVEINGKIQHFTGETKQGLTGDSSDVTVLEFNYSPEERQATETQISAYANYDDAKIKAQWASVIPRENILIIDDPKAIVDVLMGALAITAGGDIDQYLIDMGERGQTAARIAQTASSLSGLSSTAVAKISTSGLPGINTGAQRKGGSKRI